MRKPITFIDVLKHFRPEGTRAKDLALWKSKAIKSLAEDLGCTTQCVYSWKGRIPKHAAYKLCYNSNGVLDADAIIRGAEMVNEHV